VTVGLPRLLVVAVMAARQVVGQPMTRPVSATTVPPRAVVVGAPPLVSVPAAAGPDVGVGVVAALLPGCCGCGPGACVAVGVAAGVCGSACACRWAAVAGLGSTGPTESAN